MVQLGNLYGGLIVFYSLSCFLIIYYLVELIFSAVKAMQEEILRILFPQPIAFLNFWWYFDWSYGLPKLTRTKTSLKFDILYEELWPILYYMKVISKAMVKFLCKKRIVSLLSVIKNGGIPLSLFLPLRSSWTTTRKEELKCLTDSKLHSYNFSSYRPCGRLKVVVKMGCNTYLKLSGHKLPNEIGLPSFSSIAAPIS